MKLGPFELENRIGGSANSDVWRGRHEAKGVPVAVKFLSAEATQGDGRSRLRREVRSAATLDHPGIVRLYDFGEVDASIATATNFQLRPGAPYIAMEYADGGSLASLEGDFGWTRLFILVTGLLRALGHAHSRGIVHRDVKPSNVLLTTDADGERRFKLSDFGLAFLLREAADEDTEIVRTGGTPLYMAPEQFRSRWRDFGPWTDLYGLGCLVWRLVTGMHPFDGDSLLEIAEKHISSPLPAFQPRMNVPSGFDRWLARLLEKNPQNRYRFAADALWELLEMNDEFRGGTDESEVDLKVAKTEAIDALETLVGPDRDSGDFAEPPSGGMTSIGRVETTAAFSTEPITREIPPFPRKWSQEQPHERSMPTVEAGLELYNLREFPMVDRQHERDRLWEALGEVIETGSTRMAFLRGPAGVGKTRLARWLRERGEQVGAAVGLRATHSRQNAPSDGLAPMIADHLALGGLDAIEAADRIRDWYRARGVDRDHEWRALTALLVERAGIEPKSTGESDSRFEWVGSSGEITPLSEASDSDEIRALIRRFLQYAARERPLVVHLDDIHWGLETLHFVRHLVESGRTEEMPILFVGTIRADALSRRPLEARLIEGFLELDRSVMLEPEGLDEADQRILVEKHLRLTGGAAREVVRRSGGNPLYAIELVRHWLERGLLEVNAEGFSLTDPDDTPPPGDLDQIWSDRLDSLLAGASSEARTALQLGAALGRDLDEEEWRATCDLADSAFPAALVHRLVRQNLLEPTDDGWRFSHPMLREILAERARDAGRWQRLNRHCATVVEQNSLDVYRVAERLANYLLEAGDKRDALEPLLDSVEYWGRRGDYDVADDRLEIARSIADEIGVDPRDETALLMELRAARLTFVREGDHEAAIDSLREVLDTAMEHDLEEIEVETRLALCVVCARTDRLEEGYAAAEEALRRVDRRQPIRYGRVRFQLGNAALLAGELETAETNFRHAVSLFKEHAPVELAKTLIRWGMVDKHRRDFEGAERKLERALSLAHQNGSLANVALAANLLADCARMQSDHQRASEMYDRAVEAAELLGQSELFHVFLGPIQLASETGNYEKALRICDKLNRRPLEPPTSNEELYLRVLWLQAAAGARDVDLMHKNFGELEELFGSFQWRVPDLAESLETTAELARSTSEAEISEGAARLAVEQWEALGEPDRARRLRDEYLEERA